VCDAPRAAVCRIYATRPYIYTPLPARTHTDMYVWTYACTYVRTYVRMYVCMYACMYVWMYVHVRMYVCMYACMYVWMYVRMYVCTSACMHACMYGCMYVCTYARLHVCMHVCMDVCTYVCMHACVDECHGVHVRVLHGLKQLDAVKDPAHLRRSVWYVQAHMQKQRLLDEHRDLKPAYNMQRPTRNIRRAPTHCTARHARREDIARARARARVCVRASVGARGCGSQVGAGERTRAARR
jgi:hypothetical protein